MSATAAAFSCHPVVAALLGTSVLPARAEPFERVSSVIGVREALAARGNPKTVLILVPEGTSTTARYVLAGMLAANFAYENGAGYLPPAECLPFLKTQVLLISPAVAECIEYLDNLRLTGTTPLTSLWDVVPLARETPKASVKKRVFVANPGWAVSRIADRRYAAVIIDATHPRTLAPLRDLIVRSRAQSPLCVVVCPVLPANMLAELRVPDEPDVWVWDPQARMNALSAVTSAKQSTALPPLHSLLVCQEDTEADQLLGAAYTQLVSAMRLAAAQPYPGMQLAWSVLNRLRALTVPLNAYEQAAARSWSGGLSSRMRMLGDVQGHGMAAWDATWPRIRDALETAYAGFVRREHTAKFWALAERLQELLRTRDAAYRVVAPSDVESDLIASALQDVVDDVPDAIEAGRLEIVTYSDEARRVAEGQPMHSLLLGSRPSKYRYLGVYPSHPHEEIVYPFEATLSHTAISRQYEAVAKLQAESRVEMLERLGLGMMVEIAGDPTSPPRIEANRADGRAVTISKSSEVGGHLDLDTVVPAEDDVRSGSWSDRDGVPRSGESVEVTFVNGMAARYPVEALIDVYYAETDSITRLPVIELAPSHRVIRFVDSQYDNLFQRTTEAIERRLPTHSRASLALWHSAKAALARSCATKQDLFNRLQSDGLESSYATFCTWFREDGDTIAPQQESDFLVVAKTTGAFKSGKQLRDTFKCIQTVRGRHRSAGRQLRALLRAMISRDGYDEALANVRKVDPDLADVFAAVDVIEVHSVRRI